ACAEDLEECAGDVDLRAVGEECDCRFRERPLDLLRGKESEPPVHSLATPLAKPVEVDARSARDDEPSIPGPQDRFDRVLRALVRADETKCERRAAVVGAADVGAEGRV